MYHNFRETLETLWPVLALSVLGGGVRILRFGAGSLRHFISSLVGSAFAGILAHWCMAGLFVDAEIGSAAIAMAGYCGGALLDALQERIIAEVKSTGMALPSRTRPQGDKSP